MIILFLLLSDIVVAGFVLIRKTKHQKETTASTALENLKRERANTSAVAFFKLLPHDSTDIVFLGNSLTQGFPLQEMFQNLHLKNRGIAANQTGHILQRLDEVTGGHPKKIFLEAGINDIAWGVRTDSMLSNFQLIIDRIRRGSPHSRLYINSILPTSMDKKVFLPQIIESNKQLKSLCEKNHVTFIDLYPLFYSDIEKGMTDSLTFDGTHLTGKGYVIWRNAIKKCVSE